MPKKSQAKTKSTKKNNVSNIKTEKNSIWDIFKFGESYTSLILGIIVVIVATVTLLSFVKGKNTFTNTSSVNQQSVAMQLRPTDQINLTPEITKVPTITEQIKPSIVVKKVAIATAIPTKAKTVTKTAVVKATATPAPVIAKKVNSNQAHTQTIKGSTYTIANGDTLWSIAEKKYKSGYNWVDIQKANKILNPDILYAGTKLILPSVTPKIATVISTDKVVTKTVNTVQQATKISGNNYTVVRGDTLWDISVRAYGDGYAWTKIARVNNLYNPNLIHPGNKFIIPR